MDKIKNIVKISKKTFMTTTIIINSDQKEKLQKLYDLIRVSFKNSSTLWHLCVILDIATEDMLKKINTSGTINHVLYMKDEIQDSICIGISTSEDARLPYWKMVIDAYVPEASILFYSIIKPSNKILAPKNDYICITNDPFYQGRFYVKERTLNSLFHYDDALTEPEVLNVINKKNSGKYQSLDEYIEAIKVSTGCFDYYVSPWSLVSFDEHYKVCQENYLNERNSTATMSLTKK